MADIIAGYFNHLVSQGLERKEALELTRDYQSDLLESQRGSDEETVS